MKKIISKILISTILASIVFGFFVFNPKTSFATGTCTVQSATFTPNGTQVAAWYHDGHEPEVLVDIVTTNCEGQTIQASIRATIQQQSIAALNRKDIIVPASNHMIIHMKAGEDTCTSIGHSSTTPDCTFFIAVYLPGTLVTPDYETNSQATTAGKLLYKCDGYCTTANWQFLYVDRVGGQVSFDTNSFITQVNTTAANLSLIILTTEDGYVNNSAGVTLTDATGAVIGTEQLVPIANNTATQTVHAQFPNLTAGASYAWRAHITKSDTNVIKSITKTFTLQDSSHNGQPLTSGTAPQLDTGHLDDTSSSVNTNTDYYPLAPLPGVGVVCSNNPDTNDPTNKNCIHTQKDESTNPCPFGDYLNALIKIFIGICAVLAFIMIVLGGIEYITSELISNKAEGKKRITGAIFGLILALASYALLNTINPAVLQVCLNQLPQATVTIGGDTNTPIASNITGTLPSGIVCTSGQSNIPAIANSFAGKMTYLMGAKGTPGPNNTIQLDCSGFVNYVLKCAGVPFINGGTANIFSGAENVTSISGSSVNGQALHIGDLLGWMPGELGNKYGGSGHVMIYIGNSSVQAADSHGGSSVGNALGVFPITKYATDIKHIKRAP
ncbi:MAG: NlpC/P60 family protein [Candidatus Nomurabacteria bacterium]|nr:NlpC/P60 family protein [Candidatus Nomurabacteria bacterium]